MHVAHHLMRYSDLMPGNLHVVRQSGGWEVRAEGSSRARSVHPTQAEAAAAARRQAGKSGGGEVVVHDAREPVLPRAPRSVGPRTTLRVPAELAAVADRLAAELGISRNDALLRLATTGARIFEAEQMISARRAQRWKAVVPGAVVDIDVADLPSPEDARDAVLGAR